MQHSVLTRQSGHTAQPRRVCLTVSCVYTHPVQGLASLRTLDYNSDIRRRQASPEAACVPAGLPVTPSDY